MDREHRVVARKRGRRGVPKLREADVDLAKGSTVAQVTRCFPLVNPVSQDSTMETIQ
jgi:hypothetical protein